MIGKGCDFDAGAKIKKREVHGWVERRYWNTETRRALPTHQHSWDVLKPQEAQFRIVQRYRGGSCLGGRCWGLYLETDSTPSTVVHSWKESQEPKRDCFEPRLQSPRWMKGLGAAYRKSWLQSLLASVLGFAFGKLSLQAAPVERCRHLERSPDEYSGDSCDGDCNLHTLAALVESGSGRRSNTLEVKIPHRIDIIGSHHRESRTALLGSTLRRKSWRL